VSLENIPKTFASLKDAQKTAVIRRLKELHKGDWNAMSVEEKKACKLAVLLGIACYSLYLRASSTV
jgi:hypothetical protein